MVQRSSHGRDAHPILESWLLSCRSSFPLRHTLGGCRGWLRCLGHCHQHGRLRELWLLASAWCRHLGNDSRWKTSTPLLHCLPFK